jgi:hypothetical protein
MKWRTKRRNLREWHRWFAWRPVLLVDGRTAWLEIVDRRLVFAHPDCGAEWEYAV